MSSDSPEAVTPSTSSSPAGAALRRRGWLIAPLLVIAVAVGAYANSLGNSFTWDDHWLIVDNPRIGDPSYVTYMLTQPKLWRTVKRLSLMADHAIWGKPRFPGDVEHPFGFHVTNVAFHALACWLLYLTALRLGLGRPGALATGLLFALHPVHVEAVANIVDRKEMMALAFSLVAFFAWLGASTEGRATAPVTWLLRRLLPGERLDMAARVELGIWGAFFFLLGMLSKEVGTVMLVFVIIVHDLLFRTGRGRALRLGVIVAPMVAVLALFTFRGYLGSILTRFSAEQVQWVTLDKASSYGVMLLTSVKSFAFYPRILAWPWPLYADRSLALPKSVFDPGVIAGFVLIVALIAGIVWTWRRSRVACFGLAWFGLNLLPVINVVPLTYWLIAERFAYVPSAGAMLVAGVVFEAAWSGRLGRALQPLAQRRVAVGALAVLLAAYAVITVRQNRVWRNDLALWENTLRYSPESWMAWHSIAVIKQGTDEREEAEHAYRKAIELNPRYVDPHGNLARLLLIEGRYEEAIPEARFQAENDPNNPAPLVVIGNALFSLGRFEEAADAYREATARNPSYEMLAFNHANALRMLGRPAEALRRLGETAQRTDPINVLFLRGVLFETLNRPADALVNYKQALQIAPNTPDLQKMVDRLEASGPVTEAPR